MTVTVQDRHHPVIEALTQSINWQFACPDESLWRIPMMLLKRVIPKLAQQHNMPSRMTFTEIGRLAKADTYKTIEEFINLVGWRETATRIQKAATKQHT